MYITYVDAVSDNVVSWTAHSQVPSLGLQEFSNDNDATNDLQKVVHPSAIGTNMDVDLIWTKPLIGFSVGTQIRHILSSLSLGHIHLHYIKGQ